MYRIDSIKVKPDSTLSKKQIARRAGVKESAVGEYKILRKSIDARKKSDVHYVYTVAAEIAGRGIKFPTYTEEKYIFKKGKKLKKRPLIVGTGPCGLFAGLMLARAGYAPLLIERGADVDTRCERVENFKNTGVLDENTNVQFGEGGAGTFSDGKLNSGINDKRCRFVLETFADFGAPKEILYSAKPHIGTDILRSVVKNIRTEIEKCGGEVRFLNKLTGIRLDGEKAVCGAEIDSPSGAYVFDTDSIILAVGHSARDTYRMIQKLGAKMEQKNFSVGVRIEHRQKMINKSCYGDFADLFGAADYKLSAHFGGGRSAYTFCMCPGGEVVAAASYCGGIVTNGMSNSARNGENANSALLVNVNASDFASDDVLAGAVLQEQIERKAFEMGGKNYFAPAQYVGDFMGYEAVDKVKPTYLPGVKFCDISEIFPEFVTKTLRLAIAEFDKKIRGFASGGALMTAPETRSSAPVRIVREKDTFMSDISGLYPAGEGAGYAGGIMSAAVDGIKVSEALAGKN